MIFDEDFYPFCLKFTLFGNVGNNIVFVQCIPTIHYSIHLFRWQDEEIFLSTFVTWIGQTAVCLCMQDIHKHTSCWFGLLFLLLLLIIIMTTHPQSKRRRRRRPTVRLSVPYFCCCLCVVVGLWPTVTWSFSLSSKPAVPFFGQVQDWLQTQDIAYEVCRFEELLSVGAPDSTGPSSLSQPPPTSSRLLFLTTTTTPSPNTTRIALHLIATPTCLEECLPPSFLKTWTDHVVNSQFVKLIHLHEDVWYQKRDIVQGRLLAQTRPTRHLRRLYARQTMARRIPAPQAMEFLHTHHLWGATRAKYYYGLFVSGRNKKGLSPQSPPPPQQHNDNDDDELVAVATFSNRRKVRRNGALYRSHELLRLCSKRDTHVVGGISKLLRAFATDGHRPDDIVTIVDRNWGGGAGWHAVGFTTVGILDPIVMVVSPHEVGVRRHLVGAGIRPENTVESGRMGVPHRVWKELNQTSCPREARAVLARHQYYPVYDAGVERLFLVVNNNNNHTHPLELWQNSQPSYPLSYYSNNTGITSLLQEAAHTIQWMHTPPSRELDKRIIMLKSTFLRSLLLVGYLFFRQWIWKRLQSFLIFTLHDWIQRRCVWHSLTYAVPSCFQIPRTKIYVRAATPFRKPFRARTCSKQCRRFPAHPSREARFDAIVSEANVLKLNQLTCC